MKLISIFKGVIAALKDSQYHAYINVGRDGLWPSYIAMLLTIPLYLYCGHILMRGLASTTLTGNILASRPSASYIVITALYVLTFPLIAYLITLLVNRIDVFRPWVIIRNWGALILVSIMALILWLGTLGVLPIHAASTLAMIVYLATLLLDIRLAQTILDQKWTPAIFTGCIIAASSLIVFQAGLSSLPS